MFIPLLPVLRLSSSNNIGLHTIPLSTFLVVIGHQLRPPANLEMVSEKVESNVELKNSEVEEPGDHRARAKKRKPRMVNDELNHFASLNT